MLMIGAIIGRMVGLATVDIAQSLGKSWSIGKVVVCDEQFAYDTEPGQEPFNRRGMGA